MSVQVSLTRSGLPRIIPRKLRFVISKQDDRADRLVRLYISWFDLSRLIRLAPKVRKSLFEGISAPIKDKSLRLMRW